MKNCKLILFFLIGIFVFFSVNLNAQTNNDITKNVNLYTQLNQNASVILKNSDVLRSIQSNNYANVINVNQEGFNNQIDVRANANNSQNINQFGNRNEYQFINYYNSDPSNFMITQEGVGNNLQIYGQNSLSKNLQIIQKSNFKTIIIKNY